jgi:hypothetical protein
MRNVEATGTTEKACLDRWACQVIYRATSFYKGPHLHEAEIIAGRRYSGNFQANNLAAPPKRLCFRSSPTHPLAMRNLPNIIITGTPGVGKTTTCEQLVSLSSSSPPGPLRHLSINTLVKDRGCHEGFDEGMKTYIVDEDKLLDEVEKEVEDGEGEGGWLIDWHACDLFPKSWVDLVVVLRCERTDVLWDRLKARYVRHTRLGWTRKM